MVADPWSWYAEIPIARIPEPSLLLQTLLLCAFRKAEHAQVSRLYLTTSFMTTAACK